MQLTAHGWKNHFGVFGKLFYCFQVDFLIVRVFHFPFSFAVKDAEDNIVFEDGQGV